MSPVSPVFNTEATVSIGLKMYFELEHPFYNIKINCLTLSSDFYLGCQRKGDIEFWKEVLTLICNITENRNRHARGPVHALNIDSSTKIIRVLYLAKYLLNGLRMA